MCTPTLMFLYIDAEYLKAAEKAFRHLTAQQSWFIDLCKQGWQLILFMGLSLSLFA